MPPRSVPCKHDLACPHRQGWARLAYRHRHCWLAYLPLVGILLALIGGVARYQPPPAESSLTLSAVEVCYLGTAVLKDKNWTIDCALEPDFEARRYIISDDQLTLAQGRFERLEVVYFAMTTENGASKQLIEYYLYLK